MLEHRNRQRGQGLEDLVSPNILEQAQIDPNKPLAIITGRAGHPCTIFETIPNIHDERLYIIARRRRLIGSRTCMANSWYWKVESAELVQAVISAEQAKTGSITMEGLLFLDSTILTAGRNLEQIIKDFISPRFYLQSFATHQP